jgi:hypothetical protein
MKLAHVAAAFLLIARSTAAAPEPASRYRLIDLSDDYTALFDRTAGMTASERTAAFKAEIVPLFPAFYGKYRYPDMTQEAYDARIARSFERFPAIRAAYERADASFVSSLEPALESFAQLLPDLGPIGDIYLVHSLGEMDGGTRDFAGRNYFIFGADVIARVHPPGSERPFFHHELFHVYHLQWFPGCDQVWCSLWSEGAAVLAAKELNPGADDDQLLLAQPEPIRGPVDANLTGAVCAVQERLASNSDRDLDALFSFQRLNAELPPRFGYYVGYLVARHVRGTRTLQQIAHMNTDEARAAVEESLAALAACP